MSVDVTMALERLERAMARAESREWPKTVELRNLLALEDRRVLAAEVRRLRAVVVSLIAVNERA